MKANCCNAQFIVESGPESAPDPREENSERKNNRLTLLIVVAAIVCMAGVLILPQPDLPDFVINGAKSPTVVRIRAKIVSSSGMGYLGFVNPALGVKSTSRIWLTDRIC